MGIPGDDERAAQGVTKTNMAPLRGWAPRGERLRAKVPHGRWKTTTFLAALRHDRVEAPWLLKHWLRKAASRTADAVCNAIGPILV